MLVMQFIWAGPIYIQRGISDQNINEKNKGNYGNLIQVFTEFKLVLFFVQGKCLFFFFL